MVKDVSPKKTSITALKPSLTNTGSQSRQLQPINSFYQCKFFQTYSKDSRRGMNLFDFLVYGLAFWSVANT